MGRQRFYIRSPGNRKKGIPEGYLEVDPTGLHIGMLTTLYTHDNSSRERQIRYMPIHGTDQQIDTGIDPEQLREIIGEIVGNVDALSGSAQGPAGELCASLMAAIDGLWQYSELLAAGRVEEAGHALQAFGYAIVQTASSAVDAFTGLETQLAAGGSATTDDGVAPAAENAKLYEHSTESFSIAIDESLRLYREIVEIREAFEGLRRTVRSSAHSWSLDEEAGELTDHLAWLGDETTGFHVFASRYLINPIPDAKEMIVTLREEAERRLASIQAMVRLAETNQQKVWQEAQSILALQPRFENCLGRLREIRKTLKEAPTDLVVEVVQRSQLLTSEELANWQTFESHSAFSNLDRAKTNLSDLAARIWSLLDAKPQLSERADNIILKSRYYVEQLRHETGHATSNSPVRLQPGPKVTTRRRAALHKAAPPPVPTGVDHGRIDEIYQLIIAVAGHRYCGYRNYVGMTIGSVLGILVILNKVSDQEALDYREAITNRVKSRSLTVKDRSQINQIWKTASPSEGYDWIYFRPTNNSAWVWRLIDGGKNAALALAQELGISDEAARAAHELYKEQQQERRRQRLEGNGEE